MQNGRRIRARGCAFVARTVRVVRTCLPFAVIAIAPAQSSWVRAVPGYVRWQPAAYDPVRRQVMVHGGQSLLGFFDDTWFWDGSRWVGARPAASTGPFGQAVAMATDWTRNQVLLFGDRDGRTAETWTWDGRAWAQRAPAVQPPVRSSFALACDPVRGRVVLFGGLAGATVLGDTWEWDGATWVQRSPANSPNARQAHGMAFDAARGRTVLFGGHPGGPYFGDTWEWDGLDWTLRLPANSPSPRGFHAMAYDALRQRIVLHGGSSVPPAGDDTWEWDGANWQQRVAATRPPTYPGSRLVWDEASGRIVMPDTMRSGTWEWDGQQWTLRAPTATPSFRAGGAMAFEPVRGTILLVGGRDGVGNVHGDTWEWDGVAWTHRVQAGLLPARAEHALAHDPLRGTTVLYGGVVHTVLLADTWEWNGSAWTPIVAAMAPGPRSGHSMAFDLATQQVLLFGGHDGASLRDDTWAWNGTSWTQLQPVVRPPPRRHAGLAWDSAAQAVLLFGGEGPPLTAPQPLRDTWRFAGGAWQLLRPAMSPMARSQFGIAADTARGVVVMHGGIAPGAAAFGDTWEWDGTNWARTGVVLQRYGHAMAFDGLRRQVVLHGGRVGTFADDTLVLAPRGVHDVYGAGCPGTLGVPALTPSPTSVPAFGGRVAATVANVPSGLAAMAVEVASPFAAVPAAPMPLAAIGMPGCGAWLAPALLVPLVASGGVASWQLDVPWSMALNGVQLFQQAVVLDPPANAAGLTVSNAARIRIGT